VGKVGQRSRRLRRQLFDHLHQLHEYSRESLGFLGERGDPDAHALEHSVRPRSLRCPGGMRANPSPTTGASELYPNH